MATKPAKSIKFPGLEDTYTFLQNDPTLTEEGMAADAKATGDRFEAIEERIQEMARNSAGRNIVLLAGRQSADDAEAAKELADAGDAPTGAAGEALTEANDAAVAEAARQAAEAVMDKLLPTVTIEDREEAVFEDGVDGLPLCGLTVGIKADCGGEGHEKCLIRQTAGAEERTYAIEFPAEAGAVYGGTLDVTAGVLTVDRLFTDALKGLKWEQMPGRADGYMTRALPGGGTEGGAGFSIASNAYEHDGRSPEEMGNLTMRLDDETPGCLYAINEAFILNAKGFARSLKGVRLCYRAAEPAIYHLTPQEIRTLRGENRICADTGGIIALTYRADMARHIARKVAEANAGLMDALMAAMEGKRQAASDAGEEGGQET